MDAVYRHCTGPRYRITEEYVPERDALRFFTYRRYTCPLTGYRLLGGSNSLSEAVALVGRYEKADGLSERVVATVP